MFSSSLFVICLFLTRAPPRATLFPFPTLFRSPRWSSRRPRAVQVDAGAVVAQLVARAVGVLDHDGPVRAAPGPRRGRDRRERQRTRLNSSHQIISSALLGINKKYMDGTRRNLA